MHKDSLTDGIRQRMEGYHEQPDNYVWQHLAQQLDRSEAEGRKGTGLIPHALTYVLFFLVAITLTPSVNNIPSVKSVASTSPQLTVAPKASVEVTIDRDCGDKSVALLPQNGVVSKNEDRAVNISQPQELLQPDSVIVTIVENQQEKTPEESVEAPKETLGDTTQTSVAKIAKSEKTEESEKTSRAPRLISFYSSFTPSLNYFTIKPSGSDAMIVSNLVHIPVASSRRTSYQADLGFQWLVNNRITAFGGLSYHVQNIHLNYQYYEDLNYTVSPGANPGDYNISPVYQTGSITYAMRNIGVQAGILYRLQGDKLSHHGGIGLSYQHGVMAAPTDDSYNNYKSHYAFVQILYRVEFKVNPTMSLFAQPNFTQAIFSKEDLTAPFMITPYRVGFGLGAVFMIKK